MRNLAKVSKLHVCTVQNNGGHETMIENVTA
jgi:hypothetical protein